MGTKRPEMRRQFGYRGSSAPSLWYEGLGTDDAQKVGS